MVATSPATAAVVSRTRPDAIRAATHAKGAMYSRVSSEVLRIAGGPGGGVDFTERSV